MNLNERCRPYREAYEEAMAKVDHWEQTLSTDKNTNPKEFEEVLSTIRENNLECMKKIESKIVNDLRFHLYF